MNEDEVIQSAREAIERLELPEDLRPVAFGWLLTLRSGGRPRPDAGAQGVIQTDASGALERIAQQLRVPVVTLSEVYFVRDGEISLGVPAANLEPTDARGARQIALLVTAGRQAAAIDDSFTNVSVIREVCRDYGRFDQSNFAGTIGSMTDVFTFRGRGQRRQVRITRPGLDRARELVLRLSGSAAG